MTDGLTIYVGVPFCHSKCHFCRYVAEIPTAALVSSESRYDAYVQAVVDQMDGLLPRWLDGGRPIASVYFGGGTPTVLSTEQLIDLVHSLQRWTGEAGTHSVTLETTPEAVTEHDFTRLRAAGFNRISMGVQSMQDHVLRRIGRSHSSTQVPRAVEAFRAAGFDNINIDLMFGLPDETLDDVRANLEQVLALPVNHHSVYLYEPDPRTVMAQQATLTYSVDDLVQRFALVHELMGGAGFTPYNCFYYTQDGRRCDVDEAYYTLRNEWIGLGAGAHSLLNMRMYRSAHDAAGFIRYPLTLGSGVEARRNPTYLYTLSTYMLYSDPGVIFDRFEQRIGVTFDEALDLSPELREWYERAFNAGHLERTDRYVRFTSWREQARFVCEHTERRFAADILKTRKFAAPYGTTVPVQLHNPQ